MIGLLAAVTVPFLVGALAAARALGSARLIMARCGLARVQAVSRHAAIGVVIAAEVDAVWVSTFQDTNHNGVRSAEIRDGTDVPVDRPSVLVAAGAGIEIALNDPTTPVRPGDRVLLSFAPSGTASSASVYVTGSDGSRFAIRLLGATGRVRLQREDRRTGQWLDRF